MAEQKRAGKIAADLGLTLVGMAFSIPPRWHTIEPLELYEIIQQQHQAVLEPNPCDFPALPLGDDGLGHDRVQRLRVDKLLVELPQRWREAPEQP